MKKSSLLVTLPALALAGLLLSGCGMFRSTKAWETAKQETPLEIPPGLDTPPANDALVIPPPTSSQAQAAANQVADGFVAPGLVGDVYKKVGKLLDVDGIKLAKRDEGTHSYVVQVGDAAHAVQVSVDASSDSNSQVRAQGSAEAVAKVIDLLKPKLGG